ncbi:MAG: hypothetical protein WC506_01930 [Candidatus Micrarchaeia archaeon]
MRAFVFVSDVAVAIALFALALQLMPLAPAYQFYGKPAGIFASDVLMMLQQGASITQIEQAYESNSMCGRVTYYSANGAPALDSNMACQCKGGGNGGAYSLAGGVPAGFAKVTVCRQ